MADLSKIKVGDQLVCTGRVVSNMRESQSALYPLEVTFCDNDEDTSKLSLADVQAAEHIPAPRIFKRGDWVKMHLQTQSVDHTKRHGIVAGDSDAGDNVPVLWPQCLNSQFIRRDLLEPDAAPE